MAGFSLDSLNRYMAEGDAQEAELGLRGYGRKKVDDALAKIDEALKDVVHPSVRNHYDERTGLLDLLEDIVDRVGQYEEIPRDGAAMDALEEFALAVRVAFELGIAAVRGKAVDPAALAEARERQRQGSKISGGTANRVNAEAWQKAGTPTYLKLRAKFPKGSVKGSASNLAGLIIPAVQLLGYKLPGQRRVEGWVSKMDGVTPAYLELRAKFPAESADEIADRLIDKLGDQSDTKSGAAHWVSMMDDLRRPPA